MLMRNKIYLIAVSLLLSSFANGAAAQSNAHVTGSAEHVSTQPYQSASALAAETSSIKTETPKITRNVRPLPKTISTTGLASTRVYNRVINANTTAPAVNTKFVYNDRRGNTRMPVYVKTQQATGK